MRLTENSKVVTGVAPSAISSWDPDWVNLKDYNKLRIILSVNISSGTASGAVTLKQATSAAGGSAKTLGLTQYWYNNDTSAGDTLSEGTASSDTFNAGGAAASRLYVIEVDASELDTDGGFTFVRATVADIANGTGSLIYELYEPRYAEGATGTPTAIS